jgi:hypothetical protein
MPNFRNVPAFLCLVVASLSLIVALPVAHGQTLASTASFSGSVSDPSGARVANANVTLKSAEKGITRDFKTDAEGNFSFSLLPAGMEQAGMGVGPGDYNLDGHLDIFKTHFTGDTAGCYRGDGKGNFEDVTRSAKVGVETRYTCWGTGFVDFDNDGYPDVLVMTGSVYPEVERKLPQYAYKTPRILFRNLGDGTFEELSTQAGTGITTSHSSRLCAVGDFDNDGDMDVLIVNVNEPPSLLRNDVDPKQHWIKVKLEGVKSNRSAIGARVLVHYCGKKQVQAVVGQSSYYSCNDYRLHFGLGPVASVDVEVFWPSGLHETHSKLAANQLITLREGVGRVANKGWSRT